MKNIPLPDELAQQLEALAQQKNVSVVELVSGMLEQSKATETGQPEIVPNWDMILGIYDDDVTDMSTTVRETLKEYYQKKYGNPG